MSAKNLYLHFPFCRRKCTYCALPSRTGLSADVRDAYVRRLAETVRACVSDGPLATVYCGGGSPALGALKPLFDVLAPHLASDTEFTVELHPLDVSDGTLAALADGGVNRLSMGVQSLDDATLARMNRGYRADDAARAFARIRTRFDNAGIDLILGYGGDASAPGGWARLRDWGLAHCSVYSLIVEEESALGRLLAHGRTPAGGAPAGDDETLDRLAAAHACLAELGLERYEISNWARPGRECRHNLAVWRGEDYLGLGEGASGRLGRVRTYTPLTDAPGARPFAVEETTVTPDEDLRERTLFRLRTREGLDCTRFPEWRKPLNRFATEGLLVRADDSVYRLTPRGTEVCDAILTELV